MTAPHRSVPAVALDAGLDAHAVVVGCGPVGVMLALRCVQRGLRVIAIDASTEIYPHPRAIGIDDEIQRVFQDAGLLGLVESVSSPLRGAEFVDADLVRIVGFDLPDGFVGPYGHAPMRMFEQPPLERGLRDAAVAAGVDLRLGVEAVAFDDDGDGIGLTTRSAEGEGSIRARWLVGADGASSTIRKLAGIAFEDQGFDQEWLVIDTTQLDPHLELPSLATQVCDPARVVTFIPGHGTRRRWELRLLPDETADDVQRPKRIAEMLHRWVTPGQIRIDRTAVYRFHALVAERMRLGNVFLAGDSAHQMPPFNGQGMNSGIRDAENLAWRLAMVADGRCGSRVLDSYDPERRTHAEGQVTHSADAGRLIDALAAGDDFDTAAGYGGGRPFPHLECGLRVGDHGALGRPLPQPRVDGRPLDDLLGPGFSLVSDHGARAPSAATDRVWDRIGATRLALDPSLLPGVLASGSTVVVRPDRYVAAVTDDLDASTAELVDLLDVPIDARPGA